MPQIQAYVFGCSVYCPACHDRHVEGKIDGEGEPARPVYSWDSWESESPETCCECHSLLDLPLSRSGAAALLADVREAAKEGESPWKLQFLSDCLELHLWQLRAAGLTTDEKEELEDSLSRRINSPGN